jgi:hypothetical protein
VVRTDLRDTQNFTGTRRVMYMSPNVLSNQLNLSYLLPTSSKRKRVTSTAIARRSPEPNTSMMVEFNLDNAKLEDLPKRKANTSHGARRKKSRSSSREVI